MATATASIARPSEDRLFVALAGVCAAIAFTGFAETYWMQVPAGTFVGSPLLHLHGLLFSAWTLFFLTQATFIATGRYATHRAWGLAGIALATAMLFTGIMVAVSGMQHRIDNNMAEAGRAFVIVPISAISLFAAFIAAGLVNRRRSDWHKRFMLVATVNLLNAPLARYFFLAATGGGPGLRPGLGPPRPPEFALYPGLIADTIIVVAMLFDWRTRGRPHAAYLWGLGATLAVQLLRGTVSHTETWTNFTIFLERFAG